MKKKSILVYSGFMLLFIIAVFFSCERAAISIDSNKSELQVNDPSVPLNVELAEKYYKTLRANDGNKVAIKNTTTLSDNRPNRKYLIFKKAYTSSTSKATFVEVPLFYNKRPSNIIGTKEQFPKQAEANRILTSSFDRLIIYKDKKTGKIDQRIVTYIPDRSYLERHNNDASHNYINQLDPDFSGMLIYKSWDGKALFAFKISHGKRVKTFSLNRTSTKKKSGNSTMTMTCETFFNATYEQTCYYTDPEGTNEVCSDWVLIDYYEWEECHEDLTGDDCVDYGICDPEPVPDPDDPCAKLESLMGNYLFNNMMLDLRSEAGSDHESAWTANFDDMTSNSADGIANQHSVPISVSGQIDMFSHNHFNGGDPMFSNGDMAALYALYHGNKIRDPSVYLQGVTTYQGTEYFLSISDLSAFATFANGTLGNPTNFNDWSDYYYETAKDLQDFQNLSQIDAFERAFLQGIEGSGLQIFKRDPVTGEYNRMNLNPDGTTSLSNGCN